jgi:hypothetical protein
VVVRLKRLPQETPRGADVYLASNYNDWRADDPEFRFNLMADGTRQVILEPREEDFEFKLTRGSWKAEAVDAEGFVMANTIVKLGNQDTLDVEVKAWQDIDAGDLPGSRTITLKVPSYTPEDADIYIVGNFNKWRPNDPEFRLRRVEPFTYSITLKKHRGPMYFKFTRGSWLTEEYDFYGNSIENRKLRSAPGRVELSVEAWRDLLGKQGRGGEMEPPPPPFAGNAIMATQNGGVNAKNQPNFDLDKAKTGQVLSELQGRRDAMRLEIKTAKLTAQQRADRVLALSHLEEAIGKLHQSASQQTVQVLTYEDNQTVRVLTCKGQKLVSLQLRDDAPYTRTVHFRIEVPCAGELTSYVITEKPGKDILAYKLPINSIVYAIDKPRWTVKNRRERKLLYLDEELEGAVFLAKDALYQKPTLP